METLFSIAVLVILGTITNFVIVFLLNIAGIPGTLITGKYDKCNKRQFIFGYTISVIGQSFVYLAYTAFIVNWTMLAILEQDVNFFIWFIAFLVVILPLWINLIRARIEAKEVGYTNMQTEVLHITFLLTLFGFFIFAFIPKTMELIYNWLPYIGS